MFICLSVRMEEQISKMNMFSSDTLKDFTQQSTDGAQSGEPILTNYYKCARF